jgi:hypothetical protein
MKLIKYLLITLIAFSSTSFAKETLDVLVLFDTNTVNLSKDKENKISEKLVNNLNKSFYYSGLSGDAIFKLKSIVSTSVGKKGDSFDDIHTMLREKNSNGQVYNKVSAYQKTRKADVVLVITNAKDSENLCGRSLSVPNKDMGKEDGLTSGQILEYPDNGIVMLKAKASCLDHEVLASHEVGHSFGLSHGKFIADKTGDKGHYNEEVILDIRAGGHGENSSKWFGRDNFSTIMGRLSIDGYGTSHNFFSKENKFECGKNKSKECGTPNASAKDFIKANLKHYANRSESFKKL